MNGYDARIRLSFFLIRWQLSSLRCRFFSLSPQHTVEKISHLSLFPHHEQLRRVENARISKNSRLQKPNAPIF